jgi:hypothetical protein
MKNINIEFIDHKDQRYDTCGDWQYSDKSINIKISRLGDWKMDSLVAVHELIEVLLCKQDGVTEQQVDKFDFKFSSDRAKGLHPKTAEGGNDPKCPTHKQHRFANKVERMLARKMKVDWKEYARRIINL